MPLKDIPTVIIDLSKIPLTSHLDAAGRWLEQRIGNRSGLDRIATALSLIQARGALSLLSVRFIAIGTAFRGDEVAQCYLECQVPDRDNPGRAYLVAIGQDFTIRLNASAQQIIHEVQTASARLLLHELAEGLNIGGIRPFEPHPLPTYSFDIGFGG